MINGLLAFAAIVLASTQLLMLPGWWRDHRRIAAEAARPDPVWTPNWGDQPENYGPDNSTGGYARSDWDRMPVATEPFPLDRDS